MGYWKRRRLDRIHRQLQVLAEKIWECQLKREALLKKKDQLLNYKIKSWNQ